MNRKFSSVKGAALAVAACLGWASFTTVVRRIAWTALVAFAGYGGAARANVIYDVTVNYAAGAHTAAYTFSMEFLAAPTSASPITSPAALVNPSGDFANEAFVVDGNQVPLVTDALTTALLFSGNGGLSFSTSDLFTGGPVFAIVHSQSSVFVALSYGDRFSGSLVASADPIVALRTVPEPGPLALIAAALLPLGYRVMAKRPGRKQGIRNQR